MKQTMYEIQTGLVLQEVEKILKESARARGVTIKIEMSVDDVARVSYEIKEMVVI